MEGLRKLLEKLGSVVRIHVLNNACRLLGGKLCEQSLRLIIVGKDFGRPLLAHLGVQLFSLLRSHLLQSLCNVVVVIIVQT